MIAAARPRCSAIVQPIALSVSALGAHQRQQPHAQPHNIPDPAAKASMSTAVSELSKRPHQLRVCDKAVPFSVQPELRRYAMRQRAYTLKTHRGQGGAIGPVRLCGLLCAGSAE